jgi:hypothetical protein
MLLEILFVLIIALLIPTLYAQVVGVPPVPTPHKVVKRMLELADIKPVDIVYDLGCGDGRLVFAAARCGAAATGFEISPLVWLWACLCKLYLHSPAQIKYRDFLHVNLTPASVILLYLYPTTIKFWLQRKFKKELRPGTRIISYAFAIPGFPFVHQERVAPHGYIFVYQL